MKRNKGLSRAKPRGFTIIELPVVRKRGFTIIELLIVIALIAILSGVAIVAYSGYREKSRDARRKTDLSNLRDATELYRASVGSYPYTDGYIEITSGDCDPVSDNSTNSCIFNALVPNGYISQIPPDPSSVRYMYYRDDYSGCPPSTNKNKYSFYAKLEASPVSANDAATMNYSYSTCNNWVDDVGHYDMNYRVGN